MRTHGAGGIGKPSLPQHRQVERSFDQDHTGVLVNRFPGKQSALGTGKESMRKGGSGTAAVEVDDASVLAAREDDTPVEGVMARGVDQAEASKQIEGTGLCHEMPAQVSARGIADPQFPYQGGIVEPALFQIPQRLGMTFELLLIENGCLLQHGGGVLHRSLGLKISQALAKGEAPG